MDLKAIEWEIVDWICLPKCSARCLYIVDKAESLLFFLYKAEPASTSYLSHYPGNTWQLSPSKTTCTVSTNLALLHTVCFLNWVCIYNSNPTKSSYEEITWLRIWRIRWPGSAMREMCKKVIPEKLIAEILFQNLTVSAECCRSPSYWNCSSRTQSYRQHS
jgi:hypothetical protein